MKYFLFIFSFLPFVARADAISSLRGLVIESQTIVNLLLTLVFTLALVFFFWGIAKYVFKAGDEKSKEEGRSIMFWGVIALFVISSVWGIVFFLRNLLGIDNRSVISIPGFAEEASGNCDVDQNPDGC